jgi:WD40 repeat protein
MLFMDKISEGNFLFISYAHADQAFVKILIEDLKKNGISVWIDQHNIPPGTKDWEKTIREAISTASAVVLIASPSTSSSQVVRDELRLADIYQRPIYPFWIKGEHWIEAVPLGRGSIQYIDARKAYEESLAELVKALGGIPSPSVPSTDSTQQGQNQLPHLDWSDAPDVPVFFGRKAELAKLEHWIIKEHCRLVAIVGMRGIGKTRLSVRLGKGDPDQNKSLRGQRRKPSLKLGKGGIGKTDLTIKFARGIQNQFEYVIWRRLLNAPKAANILADIIRILSDQQEINLPDTVEDQIRLLISYLQQHRCLLIFDNAETILEGGKQAGQYREGYEDYGQLFRMIAEVPHNSCLLLTSREKPQDIALLEGSAQPVRSLELGGLDYKNSKRIFSTVNELQGGNFYGSEQDWQELTEFYNGNPLALELAAKHILNIYSGDIAAFLKEGKQIFRDLRGLLDWYFTRLDDFEKEIMYWLAVNREPMSFTDLKNDVLSSRAKASIITTLELLQRLIPLDRSAGHFTLQPVLMEYMTERLVEQITAEIEQKNIDLLNNHALLKALAKDYIRDIQVRLLLQPILQHFLTQGKAGCEQRLKDLLSQLREMPLAQQGYAAGNILNCLIYINADLRGTDFSYLSVWQAYLREASLIEVNFAHADLSKTVFTDIFGSVLSVAFSPNGMQLAAGTNTGEIRIWQMGDGTPLYTLSGHTDWVWGLDYSPDGVLLASGCSDQTIRLWDVANEQCIRVLHGHTHRIRSVRFSNDGTMLASASEDTTIRIWDVKSGAVSHILTGHTNPVRAIGFTPDGKMLVSGSDDQTVRIWEIRTEQCIRVLEGHTSQIWSLALSSDGTIIASGSDDRTVRMWDIQTGQCLSVLRGHTNWICSLAFAPTGTTLASGSADGTVRIWDGYTGQPMNTLLGHKNWVNAVNFSPDGGILASGSHDQTVRLWEIGTGHGLMTLQGYSNWVRSVAFSPQGNLLASGDRAVHLWNVQKGRHIATLQGHIAWVRTLAFNSDGTLLASGSDDQTVRVWKMRTAQPLYSFHGHTNRVKSLAFSPDDKYLVTGSDDHTVRLWDVQVGRHRKILRGHTNRIRSVAFNPKGIVFASGSDDWTARIWDIYEDQPLHVLEGHTNRVWSIAFSSDGTLLATGSEDATIRLWDVDSGRCLQVLQGHTNSVWCISFSPDGLLLASSSEDRTVRLWNTETGECRHILTGHTKPIWTVAFSGDSNLLSSGSHDNNVRLWDSHSGANIAILRGHTEPVWALAFNHDNSLLASCSDDGTCILWDIQHQKSRYILKSERPCERMNITGVVGLTESQKAILRALGAIEEEVEIVQ